MITRRIFLKGAMAGLAGGGAASQWLANAATAAAKPKIRIGSCVVGLEQAKEAGLDGVEIGVGNAPEKLRIADPMFRAQCKEQMAKTGLTISSFMMGLLNSYPLATINSPASSKSPAESARAKSTTR